jgi:diguanylate cyclase (GGDEF)-like protein
MFDRVQHTLGMLASIYSATHRSEAYRAEKMEDLIWSLGELLQASFSVLLRPDHHEPVILERDRGLQTGTDSLCGNESRFPYETWLHHFDSMTPDGIVHRGLIESQVPYLASGMLIERQLMRLIFLRQPDTAEFTSEESDILAGVIDNLIVRTQLVQHMEVIYSETVTDELTKVYNYRYLKRTLRQKLRELRERRHGVISVLMIDVDNLRSYNDRYGHLEASAVLAHVGSVLRDSLSLEGWIAKYGGDEFLAYLPDVTGDEASAEADRLRSAIEHAGIGKPEFGGITCSLGVATAPDNGVMFVDLLENADKALFFAKRQGRNRIAQVADVKDQIETDPNSEDQDSGRAA